MIARSPQRPRRFLSLALAACLVVSLTCVVYPIYVIRPFRAQGMRELAAALVVTRFRPLVTVISAVAALAAVLLYWRGPVRWWHRVLSVACAGFVCVLAFLARVNVYELMFHPIGRPSFASASQVKLDADEKVIAVKVHGEARAYPIRSMSYHHVANDVVGKLAIVATY
jgi:uncharacterized membrane protein YozB (DUF420 family)